MTFNPEVIVGNKYSNENVTIKVLNIEGTVSKRSVYVNIDENDNIISPEIKANSFQWNNLKLKDISEKSQTSYENENGTNNTNTFTFEFSDEGILSIKKDGKVIEHFNLRGQEGKPGRNGMSGQDGIPGRQGQDGTPGKPGTDGAVGTQGPKGESGIQGIPGSSGRDGEIWTPLITDDGNFLYFRNSKGDETNRFPIKGAKGDQGAEGIQGKQGEVGPVFMPSISSDGNLSWSNNGTELPNPTSVNIKGEQGIQGESGIIFHPIINDGVLFWANDRGVENPTPVRITGPQGIQGEKGNTGRSAYEIWLKEGNLGTEKEFLESLKGEQGVPAPPANFSFKDVEDFTCPVQKIGTKLITGYNDLYDNKTPEQIIQQRIDDIEDIRKEGAKLFKDVEKEGYRKNNCFKEAMWWCAGADRRLLRMCPGDHSKYVGLGTVIFFTALMAWFSSFIAMQLVFDDKKIYGDYGVWYAAIFATFWAMMIFFLDRFITNSMYSDGKVTISKKELLSGLPRIVIAIFLGIIISAPLELKIFHQEITEQMKKCLDKRAKEMVYEDIKYINAKKIEDNAFSELRISKEQRDCISTKDSAYYDPKIYKTAHTFATSISGETNHFGTAGKVFNSKKFNAARQIAQEQYNSCNLKYLNTLSNTQRIKELVLDSINRTSVKVDSVGLYEHLHALHAIAMKEYEPWFYDEEPDSIKNKNNNERISNGFVAKTDTTKTVNEKATKNKKIDNKYGAENNKIWAALDTVLHAWWWFLFNSSIGLIMFLFILIDISPVLYKMMLADGRYENYLHQEILLAQDKIRLSLAKILKKLDEGDLKRVAPFIMGNIYEKMADESFIFKTEEEYSKEIEKKYNEDKSWFERLFSKKVPKVPAIIFTLKEQNDLDKKLEEVNKKVFEEVLDMKKRIILASYRRWYKTQHDSIICDPVNDENAGKEPFDDLDDSKQEKTDESSNNKNTKEEDATEQV